MLRNYLGNKLFKSFSVYVFSNLFNSAIGLLLLPLFTHYLNPSDYGILSLINTAVAIFSILIMVGSDGSLRREFYNSSGSKYSTYFSSSVFTTLIAFLLVVVVAIGTQHWIVPLSQIPSKWFFLSILISALSILPTILLGQYRLEQKAFSFAVFSNLMTLLNLGMGILFVAILNMNYEGRGYSLIITNIVFCVVSIVILRRKKLFGKNLVKQDMKASLNYGLPLIPHQVGSLLMNFSDRYFIANLVSLSEAGFYNVGYTIGSLIGKIEGSFTQAFVPFLFEQLGKNTPEADKKIVKVSYIFIAGLLISTVLMYFFSEIVYKYFIDAKYLPGKKFVILIGFGYFFSGCYKLFAGYIFYTKKTIYLTYLSVFNVVVNVTLNYFLISNYGTIGAAYATLISFFLMCLITFLISYKIRPMPWLLK